MQTAYYIVRTVTPFFIKYFFFKDYSFHFYVSCKNLYMALYYFKNHSLFQFKTLCDIVVSDSPGKKARFSLTYILFSKVYALRLKLIIYSAEMQRAVSAINLFKNANWAEREIWDMFGIVFQKHPDLRRILSDYGFSSFPLRKDFPLSGFIELNYNQNQKRLLYGRVVLAQEYRNFWFDHYSSYWGFQKFSLHKQVAIMILIWAFCLTVRSSFRPRWKDIDDEYVALFVETYFIWRDVFLPFDPQKSFKNA